MQCPSCDFEAAQAAFGEPLRCPECGAYYEKALKLKHSSAQPAPVSPPVAPAPKKQQAFPAHAQVANRGIELAQPVVVVDIQMRFWSMVVFMIKFALASIPALLALTLIAAAFTSVVGVWFTSFFR